MFLFFPYKLIITFYKRELQGYDNSPWKFTAPRDGTFVFTVTVVSWGKNYLHLDIVHDGVSKVKTHSSSSASHQTGTNLVVLQLDRGDAVWVMRDKVMALILCL